jgi:CBS domain containing-hemolysin-like protein
MWIITLFIILIFFLLAAFFSGMETGLVSIDRLKLEKEAKEDKKKKHILHFLENPDQLFGTTLFGTNISIVVVSSLTVFLVHSLPFSNKNYQTLATIVLAGLILIFAEVIPKALFRDRPNKMVNKYFPLLIFFNILLKPFVKFVEILNRALAKLFKLPEQSGYHLLTKEDLSYMLKETEHDGSLEEDQRDMLEEALEFSELDAENVMIHRTEIVALHKDSPIKEIVEIAKKEGFTRFPVYDNNLDEIIGILIIYDLLKKKRNDKLKASDFVREAFFAPENMDVNVLLTEMQTKKKSMAIIVDSFGGTAGLITVEDILEEIVGEIEDEYDTTIVEVQKIDENTFIVQGFVEIDFLNDDYDMQLPEGDYETIAGLIISELARIPNQGTKLNIGNWIVQVIQVTNRKIIKIKMTKNAV